MNGKERNEHETPCPHCGADAQWSFLDTEKTRVEVVCPECGLYEMPREEFDQTTSEHSGIDEADRH